MSLRRRKETLNYFEIKFELKMDYFYPTSQIISRFLFMEGDLRCQLLDDFFFRDSFMISKSVKPNTSTDLSFLNSHLVILDLGLPVFFSQCFLWSNIWKGGKWVSKIIIVVYRMIQWVGDL